MALKYKGFIIEKRYSVCADWKLDKHDRVVPRRPKPEDIECYDIFDPMQDGDRWISCDTVAECKAEIDKFLVKAGMKSNLPSEWGKLDG